MEKKFQKGNKEYLVIVSLRSYYYNSNYKFRVNIYTRLKGKRKWCSFINTEDYEYRRFGMDEKEKFREITILNEIPQEWIDEVKSMELDRISKLEYYY